MNKIITSLLIIFTSVCSFAQTYYKTSDEQNAYGENTQAYFESSDGNFFHVYFNTFSSNLGSFPDTDLHIDKYSECGALLLEKVIQFPANFQHYTWDTDLNYAVPTNDGGLVTLSQGGTEGFLVIRFNADLNLYWQKTYDTQYGPGTTIEDLIYTDSDNIVIVGHRGTDPVDPEHGMVAIQLNGANGSIQWDHIYGELALPGWENQTFWVDEIIDLNNGQYAMAGYYVKADSPSNIRGFVIFVNETDGSPLTSQFYEATNSNGNIDFLTFNDIDLLANGNLALTGYTNPTSGPSTGGLCRIIVSPDGSTIIGSYELFFNDVTNSSNGLTQGLDMNESVVVGNKIFTAISVYNSSNIYDRMFVEVGGNVSGYQYETHNAAAGFEYKRTVTTTSLGEILIGGQAIDGSNSSDEHFTYYYNLDQNAQYDCSVYEGAQTVNIVTGRGNLFMDVFPIDFNPTPVNFPIDSLSNLHDAFCCTIEFESISPDQTICEGDPIQLYAYPDCAATIEWFDPQGNLLGSGNTFNPSSPFEDYYEVFATFGDCEVQEFINVIFNGPQAEFQLMYLCENDPPIPFFITQFSDLMSGDITVEVDGGINDNALGINMPPNFAVTFDPSAVGSGQYTVTICDNTGAEPCCTDVIIVVLSSPDWLIPSPTVCSSDAPFDMHDQLPWNVINVSYYGDLNGIDQSTHVYDPSQADIGVNNFSVCYSFYGGGICCSSYSVEVIEAPQPNFQTITLCETDGPVEFFSAPFFEVVGNNGITVDLTSPPPLNDPLDYYTTGWPIPATVYHYVFDPSIAGPGTYTVDICNGSNQNDCCTEVTFIVCPVPQIDLSATYNNCNLILTASLLNPSANCPVTYTWIGPCGISVDQGPNSILSGCGPGVYNVIAESASGCIGTATIEIFDVPVSISTSPIIPCDGDSVDLTIISSNPLIDIEWFDELGNPLGSANPLTVSSAGEYCFTAFDSITDCPVSDCYVVTYNSGPSVSVVGNSVICYGDDIVLIASTTDLCGSTFTWEWLANGNPITGQTSSTLNISSLPYAPGTVISVEACCGNCCTIVEAAVVQKMPKVYLGLIKDIDLCTWDGNPIQLVGSTSGADFCFYGGPGVDPLTGLFDPSIPGTGGPYDLTYNCVIGTCTTSYSIQVNISDGYWHQTTKNTDWRDMANDVITDVAGNVYVTGLYLVETTFNGGAGNDITVQSGSGTTTPYPYSFVAKYDECGLLLWVAHSIQTPASQSNYGSSITYDEINGLVYVAGNYENEIYFIDGQGGSLGLFNNNGHQGYVACFNEADGTINFVDEVTRNSYTELRAITINENNGLIYVGGDHFVANTTGDKNVFVRRYNPTIGGIGIQDWQVDGNGGLNGGNSFLHDIDFDENASVNGSLWLIGEFDLGFEFFGTAPSLFNGMLNGNTDAYVAKWDDAATPNPVFLKQGGATNGPMTGRGISVNETDGNAYVTGTYGGTVANAFGFGAMPNTATNNAYFASFNADGSLPIWPPQYAVANVEQVRGVSASYKNGVAYFAGIYNGGDVNFSGTSLIYSGPISVPPMYHTYAVAYNANSGGLLWVNGTASNNITDFHVANSITTDDNGHAFIVGIYRGDMDYISGNPASGTLVSTTTGSNAFTMRVDLAGNGAFKMAETIASDEKVEIIESNNNLQITAAPNPTNDYTVISINNYDDEANYQLSVLSLDGRLIYQEVMNSAKTELDLTVFETGVYFVQVTDGTTIALKKIVKAN